MAILSKNTTIGGKKPLLPSQDYTKNTTPEVNLGVSYTVLTGSVDLDNILTEGNYTINNCTSPLNFPEDYVWTNSKNAHLRVFRLNGSSEVVQIITKQPEDENDETIGFYFRVKYSSTQWTLWRKLLDNTSGGTITQSNTFSTTPVKIDTWIDNTPVWRLAIHRTLTDDEINNGYITHPAMNVVNNSNNLTPLDMVLYVTSGGTSIIDSYGSVYNGVIYSNGTTIGIDTTLYNEITDNELIEIFGYVDFVTVESNIKDTPEPTVISLIVDENGDATLTGIETTAVVDENGDLTFTGISTANVDSDGNLTFSV